MFPSMSICVNFSRIFMGSIFDFRSIILKMVAPDALAFAKASRYDVALDKSSAPYITP